MKSVWIEEQRDSFPVSRMCAVLSVSRSGYYAWRERPAIARGQHQEALVAEMRQIHSEGDLKYYGSPRMQRELQGRKQRRGAPPAD